MRGRDGGIIDPASQENVYFRWFSAIQYRPPLENDVCPHHSLIHIGYHPDVNSFSQHKVNWKHFTNPYVREFFEKKNIEPKGYEIIRPTLTNVKKAVLKMDVVPVLETDLDQKILAITDKCFFTRFASIFDKCVVKDKDELPYTPKASPGVIWRSLGVRNKKQFFEQCLPDYYDFWQNAHLMGYPIPAGVVVKTELLKQKKIDNDDPRVYDPMDAAFCLSLDQLSRSTNDLLKEHPDVLVGFVKQFGGFNKLAKDLQMVPGFSTLREGDVSKWDASMRKYLFDRIKLIRYLSFTPFYRNYWETPNFRPQYMLVKFTNQTFYVNKIGGLWRRLDYYYEKGIVITYLVMPNGQVLIKQHSNPSGSPNTTPDNTLGHEHVMDYSIIYAIYYHWNHEPLVISDLEDHPQQIVDRYVTKKLYADDHLLSIACDFHNIWTLNIMEQTYRMCGIQLDLTRSIDDPCIEKHTLLGSQFKEFDFYGMKFIVPVPDPIKGMCSIYKYVERTTLNEIYTVCCAHEMEQTFGDYHSIFSELCDYLEQQGALFQEHMYDFQAILGYQLLNRIRSRDARIKFLLGLEGKRYF